MSLKLNFFGLSDIGLVRSNNEDVWTALPDVGFFALADGMGGHSAGEVAAKETIEHLSKIFGSLLLPPQFCSKKLSEKMRESIESANQWVYRMSKKQTSLAGMGTTLCCLYWTSHAVIYAHVGDSRIYRLRNDKLDLLTQDHSLFAKWLAMGKRARECDTPYPYKNVITKAIGTHPRSDPEIAISPYEPNDLFILCTDGLTDVLTDDEMKKIIDRSSDLSTAAERLIQKAKIKGSNDNITVLMVQCEQSDGKNLF